MKVYFVGIAGAGVSALASIFKSEGFEVSGSDEGVFPPISTYLERMNIKYHTKFDKKNLPKKIDIAIIGTTAKINPETNPELKEIIERNIPYYTFAEYLGFHTKTRENLVIAGSFGKSSLTALITHILCEAGKNPGWFLGAISKNLPQTGAWGKDKEFIMEGDEYVISLADKRSKFELYNPKDILLSSIVHDHINMFPTMQEYELRFAKLIEKIQTSGKIIAAHKYEPIHRLINLAQKNENVIWYGLEKNSGFYCQNIKIGEITKFELVTPDNEIIKLKTSQLGHHNIENIIAAAAYLLSKKLVNKSQLQKGVESFSGVERRLDKKTIKSKIPAYEGFGSSYEKARSAIEAIKLHFPNRPLLVVFEPHTFSWRNRESLHWYDSVFEDCDAIYMLPPPNIGAQNHSQLKIEEIIERCKKAGFDACGFESGKEIMAELKKSLSGNEVILLLSSGPLDGLAKDLPILLDESF